MKCLCDGVSAKQNCASNLPRETSASHTQSIKWRVAASVWNLFSYCCSNIGPLFHYSIDDDDGDHSSHWVWNNCPRIMCLVSDFSKFFVAMTQLKRLWWYDIRITLNTYIYIYLNSKYIHIGWICCCSCSNGANIAYNMH